MTESAAPEPEELLAQSAWLRRLARSLVRDADAADDLVQDAWVAALQSAPSEPGGLTPWLGRVVRNLASKRVRSEGHRRLREEANARNDSDESQRELEERVELQRELLDLVLGLEQPYRTTLLERYFEERLPAEIARRNGVPVRTVKTRLARGLALLRERLGRRHRTDLPVIVGGLVKLAKRPTPLTGVLLGGLLVNAKLATAGALALAAALGLFWMHSATTPPGHGPEPALSAAQAGRADELGIESTSTADPRSATAVPGDAGPAPRAPDARALHGLVVDTRRTPIAGASIVVLRAVGSHDVSGPRVDEQQVRVAQLTSDAAGRFEVPLAEGMAFEVEVRARGFAPLRSPDATAGSEFVVVLGRASSLSGLVRRRSGGSPCAGALVRCGPVRSEEAGPIRSEVETDENGRYQFADLPPGALALDVLPVDAAPLGSVLVQLAEGEAATRDLLVESGTEIEGTVLDADSGDPIAGAVVGPTYAYPSAEPTHATVSDANGRFHLRGMAGGSPYTQIGVRAQGFGFETVRIWTTVARAEPVEVRLRSGVHVRGSLVDAEGRAVAGASVRATGRGAGLGASGYDTLGTRSDAQGRFELDGLRRDLWWNLRIDSDTAATRLVTLPEPPLRGTCVDFGELGLAAPATVRGRLVDEHAEGIAGFYVCLQTDRYDSGPFPAAYPADGQAGKRQVRTDAQGRFAFGCVGGGTWRLWAGIKGCARTVERDLVVESGVESGELALVLDLGEAISGTILAPDGLPVPQCVLDFYVQGDEERRSSYLLTRADGSFRMTGLESGDYTLVARPDALSTINAQAELATSCWERIASGTRDLKLVLSPSAVVSGVVELPDGSHEAACTVHAFRGGAGLEGWPEATAFTDDAGRFRLVLSSGAKYGLRANRYSLQPSENGFDMCELRDVEAGAREVVLRLVHHP